MKKLLSMIFIVSCCATFLDGARCGKKERKLRELFGGIGGDLPPGISKRLNNCRESDRNHKGAFKRHNEQSIG